MKTIRNHYNALSVSLQRSAAPKEKLNLEFRIYDDGVGFRYEIPSQPGLSEFVIMEELTEFALANEMTAWWIPAYGDNMDSEALFKSNLVSELKEKMHTPVTMESGDSLFVSSFPWETNLAFDPGRGRSD